ncbi:MAG: hypothetical protein IT385_07320 [Deltaproteobacteria bacterium]|nr:hypothetical protein [Deltaproteobacteria bacterium]
MPPEEPPNSAPSSAAPDARPQGSGKDELDALVRAWAAPPAAPPRDERIEGMRALRKALAIRIAITVVLVFMAAIVMLRTRHGIAYFFASGTPTALGDLRERYTRGDRVLGGAHDSYVEVAGLVPTRVIGVAPEGEEAGGALEFVFFCPLYDITVLSRQRVEIPAGGWSEFDPRLRDLVLQGIADPAETMVSWRGSGRLIQGSSAPADLRPFVNAYARRLGRTPADTWVLVEGQAPSHYTPTFILWLASLFAVGVSIFFLIRARRAWEKAVDPGPRP